MTVLPWASVDYVLDWPPELLEREIRALVTDPYRYWSSAAAALLLEEAFHTAVPAEDFARICGPDDVFGHAEAGPKWLDDLLDHLEDLRPYRPPQPYWSARQATTTPPPPAGADAHEAFADLITTLRGRGYLDREFAEACVLDDYARSDLDSELKKRLGLSDAEPALWPLQPASWDTDTFCSLVEVFHDLVARPRHRVSCQAEEAQCGPHHVDFDTDAGRRIYCCLVNKLLADHGTRFRLAETGENAGRLIEDVDDARADLMERATTSAAPDAADRVAHAISQWQRRDASEHDKRSAVISLYGVLEERRSLIRTELSRKDEGALFQIANEFAIRHQNRAQQGDYDPAFLDWIFWCDLSTIELTNRIVARQSTDGS